MFDQLGKTFGMYIVNILFSVYEKKNKCEEGGKADLYFYI